MSFGRRSSSLSKQLNPLTNTSLLDAHRTQKAVSRLTNELIQTPKEETQRIGSYQQQLFERLRQVIDESTNLKLSETQSDLAKRFGGSLSSTFGNDLMSRIERERLRSLSDAQLDATLYGQQLADEAELARIRKLNILQGQLSRLSSSLRSTEYFKETLRRQERDSKRGFLLRAIETVGSLPFLNKLF